MRKYKVIRTFFQRNKQYKENNMDNNYQVYPQIIVNFHPCHHGRRELSLLPHFDYLKWCTHLFLYMTPHEGQWSDDSDPQNIIIIIKSNGCSTPVPSFHKVISCWWFFQNNPDLFPEKKFVPIEWHVRLSSNISNVCPWLNSDNSVDQPPFTLFFFYWPLVHGVCPNHEVVMFQPRTVNPPYLVSVVNCYIRYYYS